MPIAPLLNSRPGSGFFSPLHCRKGQGLTEYLILLILVAVISIGAVKSLGGTVKRKIETANRRINADVSLE
jgi:hypothetical protein